MCLSHSFSRNKDNWTKCMKKCSVSSQNSICNPLVSLPSQEPALTSMSLWNRGAFSSYVKIKQIAISSLALPATFEESEMMIYAFFLARIGRCSQQYCFFKLKIAVAEHLSTTEVWFCEELELVAFISLSFIWSRLHLYFD